MQNLCLVQKHLKRRKALALSTSIGVEDKKKYLPCLSSVDYSSSEHSMSEDNSAEGNSSSEDEDAPKRKVLCRRPLQWRSMEPYSLFSRLDRKVHENSLNVVPLWQLIRKMALHLPERYQRMLLHLLSHKEKNHIYSSVSVTIIWMLYMLDTKEKVLVITTAWLK